MRSTVLVLVAAMGCGGGENDPPLAYRLGVHWVEPQPVQPTVFIDGVARMQLETSYETAMLAEGEQHTVELRDGDAVIDSLTLTIGSGTNGGCLMRNGNYATEYAQDFCALPSGELRFFSDSGLIPTGDGVAHCVGDGFCQP